MTSKERYENIEIPAQLTEVIRQAQRKAAARKKSSRIIRYASALAACAAFLFIVNIPTVANAMVKIPVVGTIVQVLQFGDGGKITDGVTVGSDATQNTLKIHFSTDDQDQTNDAPYYNVVHKSAPNRILFTFSGARYMDMEKVKNDFMTQPLVKDVYGSMILDDSSVGFVVVLKEGVQYSVTEFKNPGYLEVKLTSDGKPVTPRKVFSLRTESMPFGESMGILKESYPDEDISFLKTSTDEFTAVIGEYSTAEEAELKLKELAKLPEYNGEFYVDSWMSNENPK
ncbi:hypothetical protein [Paenibacillus cucumis (ex Kampfer et al. 2016)]|uniref:DUF4179 domain-containing protein n=1 Tax=Paenibacillus cucumis (ex Kampfer et al. 2016) TaxID=1776858 RepID=A0ABS7KQG2_9BACL|nr:MULTISPECIES: hypothetical protein [Paenibacillus]MBY0206409.1 hypothetical protein [Paenibacillus cucumis (ex Kampfer et al. 2016)]